jgi:hypothetical protein
VSGETAGQLAYEHRLALAIADGRTMPGWASQTAAWRQGWEDTAQVGHAAIAAQEPHAAAELVRAMGVIAAYEDYARRMTIPDATARAALRERHGVEPAPGPDELREKLEAAEQEAVDVRGCAVHAFAIIAVLARDNPAAQRQANDLRKQIGMLPSPPEAEIAEPQPAPELAAAMAESRGYREALQVIAGYAAGTATKQMIGTTARHALDGKS